MIRRFIFSRALRAILLCLMTVGILSSHCAVGSDYMDPRLVRMMHATVSVEAQSTYGWRTVATGVLVKTSDGPMLLTAEHVVMGGLDDPRMPVLRVCSAAAIDDCLVLHMENAILDLDASMSTDWALVPLPKKLPKSWRATKAASQEARMGDDTMIIGYPGGQGPWLSEGVVALADMPAMYGLDCSASPGNSGGGVWNSEGRLIGILSAVRVDTTFGIPQLLPTQSLAVKVTAIPFL